MDGRNSNDTHYFSKLSNFSTKWILGFLSFLLAFSSIYDKDCQWTGEHLSLEEFKLGVFK